MHARIYNVRAAGAMDAQLKDCTTIHAENYFLHVFIYSAGIIAPGEWACTLLI